MQVFYSLLAMMLVAVLSMTVQRSSHRMDSRMYVNEVVTQASGVATATLEAISLRPFDEKTDTTKVSTFPAVKSRYELTQEGSFGGCVDFNLCEDIDDFDGMVVDRVYDGFHYRVSITVRYVDPLSPSIYTGAQTFAKEVLIEVENPYLQVGDTGTPLKVPFRRIFSYDKATHI